jgi:hypothetical protein
MREYTIYKEVLCLGFVMMMTEERELRLRLFLGFFVVGLGQLGLKKRFCYLGCYLHHILFNM